MKKYLKARLIHNEVEKERLDELVLHFPDIDITSHWFDIEDNGEWHDTCESYNDLVYIGYTGQGIMLNRHTQLEFYRDIIFDEINKL